MFNSAADTEKSFHLQGPKTGPRGPTAAASTLSNPIISFYIKLPLVQLYPLISQVSNPLSPTAALTVNICLFFGEKKTLCAAICCTDWATTWHTRLDNRITAWRNIYLRVSLRAITIHRGPFFVRRVNESSTWNTHLWWYPTLMKAGTCKCCCYFIWTWLLCLWGGGGVSGIQLAARRPMHKLRLGVPTRFLSNHNPPPLPPQCKHALMWKWRCM